MKLFGITGRNEFRKYTEIHFSVEHEEEVLEEWLENNPDSIVEDEKLLLIGRQVTTNLGGYIDLLAIDRQGHTVVIELKRDRTPRDTLAQALEYAAFAAQLDYDQLEDLFRMAAGDEMASLAQYHRDYFELSTDEAVVFNKDQRIVIVGQKITPAIRQTSTFLLQKGIWVTCIEFTFFEADDGSRLLSSDVLVGGKEATRPSRISTVSLPTIDREEFLDSLDEYGKPVFSRLLELADENAFPLHWGTKGFSLNVDLGGTHVVICFGYPPDCVYKQSLYTWFRSRWGLLGKVNIPEDRIQSLFSETKATGLFQEAGRELKCLIDRPFSPDEIDTLIFWCLRMAETIVEYGLKE